ncbi:AEC family transporter [Deferribacteres bacterium DY0037]
MPIFIILGIANIYYRVFKPDIKQLVDISLYIFSPSVVFYGLVKENVSIMIMSRYLFLMLIMTTLLMLLGYFAGRVLRLSRNNIILFMLSVSMINIGNFGVPLIHFTYGDAGLSPSILTFVAFNMPLVTVAIYLSSNEATISGALKDVIRIPMFPATVLAIIITSLHIPVPETIMKLTGFIGQATFPFFIFVLGLQMTTIKLNRKIIGAAMASVLIRLGISPFIMAGVLMMMSFDGLPYSVALVQASGPSALLPLMYAVKFGREADLLAAAILLSTAISAFTLPVVIHFAG